MGWHVRAHVNSFAIRLEPNQVFRPYYLYKLCKQFSSLWWSSGNMYKTEKMSVTLRLTFYKKKLHKQGSFIFLTYVALFCNLKFYIPTYNNDMFMELFKLKVKGTTPSCIDFCPKFGNYQITIFCRNRIVTRISPNLKQVLIQILFHLQWIRKQIPNGKRLAKY